MKCHSRRHYNYDHVMMWNQNIGLCVFSTFFFFICLPERSTVHHQRPFFFRGLWSFIANDSVDLRLIFLFPLFQHFKSSLLKRKFRRQIHMFSARFLNMFFCFIFCLYIHLMIFWKIHINYTCFFVHLLKSFDEILWVA